MFHRRGLIVNVGRRHFQGDILILCSSVGRLYVHLLDLHVVIFCKTVVSNVGLNRAIQSCSEVGHSSYKIIGCSSIEFSVTLSSLLITKQYPPLKRALLCL
jgi:hypothetical protein